MYESKNENQSSSFATGSVVDGRYRITARLGVGSDGATYRAQDLDHGSNHRKAGSPNDPRDVLLKVYNVEGTWSAVRAWEREARALENLDHPAIPRCIEHKQLATGELLMVRAYCPGKTLQQRIDAGERLAGERVHCLTERLLDVLVHMQSLNPPVIHGDIKPSNIVVGDDGLAHLIDFAGVRATLRPRGTSGLGSGTVGYAAPEQAAGRPGLGSDLYALGATLVHVLSHVHPSDLPARGLTLDFAQHVAVEPSLVAWLGRLLEPKPEERFASAVAARDAYLGDVSALPRGGDSTTSSSALKPTGAAVPSDASAPVLQPPPDSKIAVSTSVETLRLVIGGVGFFGRGVRVETVIMALWMAHVTVFTIGMFDAARGSAMPLLMLPFWLVGLFIGARLAFSMWGRTTVEVGPNGSSVHKRLGVWSQRVHAPLSRWAGARITIARTRNVTRHHCTVSLGVEEVRFGDKLATVEQEWVVGLLNGWAEKHGARAMDRQSLTR